jgi:hypothetical protein
LNVLSKGWVELAEGAWLKPKQTLRECVEAFCPTLKTWSCKLIERTYAAKLVFEQALSCFTARLAEDLPL